MSGNQPYRVSIGAFVVGIALGIAVPCAHGQAYGGSPYHGAPFTISASGQSKLDAVDFDKGGEGVAYHDTDAANAGKQYRPDEGVDISNSSDVGGGYRIGFIASGEWVRYSVDVQKAGRYSITFRVSSRGTTTAGKMHIEDSAGKELSPTIDVPGTNNAWGDVTTTADLPAGKQVLTLKFDTGGFNLSRLTFAPADASAPAANAGNNAEVVVVDLTDPGAAPAAQAPAAPTAASSVAAATADTFSGKLNIGASKPAGKATFDAGKYSLVGGTKIGGTSDSFFFACAPAGEVTQIMAHVDSVEGTGSAGIMFRDGPAPDSRFVAVLATAANGVIFQRRAENGASALSATAPGAKPPVWVRLSHAGADFSAAYAMTSGTPEATDWKPIGSPKPVALSSGARFGLAAALDTGSAALSSVATDTASSAAAPTATEVVVVQTDAAQPAANSAPSRLAGRIIGTAGSFDGSSTKEKAFDGDMNTYFDPPKGEVHNMWCGLDFGAPQRITRITYAPRNGWQARIVGGRFEASDNPNFTQAITLASVTSTPPGGTLTNIDVDSKRGYRYFRYVGGSDHLNIAEIQVYGSAAGGTSADAAPTAASPMETMKAQAAGVVQKLSGQVIGTAGGYKDSTTREKAFDGDLNTFFDPPGTADPNTMWCGLDFGAPVRISRICYAPRTGWESRMIGGRFEASDSPTFASGVVQLAAITTAPPAGRLTAITVDSARPYRYFRYVGGTGHLHVAEIEVYGSAAGGGPAESTTPVAPPAASASATAAVASIQGKTFNLSPKAIDWIHWGHDKQRLNRKSGVLARISDVTTNGNMDFFNDNRAFYTWTDGMPAQRVAQTPMAIFTSGAFSFTVTPGDTLPHTLTVFVGGVNSQGTLTATMGGSEVYVDRNRGNLTEHYYHAYTIKFRAPQASDVLTIEWKMTNNGNGGNIQLHAAQLQ